MKCVIERRESEREIQRFKKRENIKILSIYIICTVIFFESSFVEGERERDSTPFRFYVITSKSKID